MKCSKLFACIVVFSAACGQTSPTQPTPRVDQNLPQVSSVAILDLNGSDANLVVRNTYTIAPETKQAYGSNLTVYSCPSPGQGKISSNQCKGLPAGGYTGTTENRIVPGSAPMVASVLISEVYENKPPDPSLLRPNGEYTFDEFAALHNGKFIAGDQRVRP